MADIKTPTITYIGINQQVGYDNSTETILDCSISNQIPHIHECGGNGLCTTCRIRVLRGHDNLNPRTLREQEIARVRKWDPSIRLACQCYVKGDVSIQRLIWTSSEINKLQLETVPEGTAKERAIAILFCDIRGFTKMTSQNYSFDVAHILNRFYTVLGDPILINNGVIYQYVGDEIIGIFGVSGGMKDKNCKDAVRAALGMQYAIERLNHMELVDFDVNLKLGIGINFGKAYIGHLGHPKHKQFAVVGDPVNTASRIQSYNKIAKTNILISDSIFKGLSEATVEIGETFNQQMAGHEHLTRFHELKGFKEIDIQLELQRSLDYLLRNEEDFADKFYAKVFNKAPKIRSLFKNNMTSQGRLLTHMLAGIVYSMSRPDHLSLGLKLLGQSHSRYGVLKEHYPIVLSALLETIKEELGEFYTDQLINAWEQALTIITNEMKKYA
ncbi:2Fe-2S iron-sulfur cluster-binding protein [Flavobacteriaceae bacterium GSB9]|nr:2Fe-2S iron-sulfur cluster-binding protein [Flavobacteriaceae bacterium GSB9]